MCACNFRDTGAGCFLFQAEEGRRERCPSRGLVDVYKRQGRSSAKRRPMPRRRASAASSSAETLFSGAITALSFVDDACFVRERGGTVSEG